MTEKIVSFWEYVKLRSLSVLSGTRAEYRPGKTEDSDANEYVINGVRYVVSTRFSKKRKQNNERKNISFYRKRFCTFDNCR